MISTLDKIGERPRPVLASPIPLGRPGGNEDGAGSGNGGRGANGRKNANGRRQSEAAGRIGGVHVQMAAATDIAMSPQIRLGLRFLGDSYIYARDRSGDPWQFSVEWLELRRLGVTCNDIRRLIHQGLVRNAHEITEIGDKERRFVPCSNLNLSERTCFIVTDEGCQVASRLVSPQGGAVAVTEKPIAASLIGPTPADGHGTLERLVPKWDPDRRQLRVDATIVKEFKVPATNQVIILAVFEEESWPPKIDDPLPQKSDIDPQRRLHDTINSLNRRQRHRLLHFGADGLGRGIRWDFLGKPRSRE